MTNTNLHHAQDELDDDETFPELDEDSADRLIEHIRRERDGGTFGSMDGDSAATWIIDRIGHLLDHPEDV